MSRCSHPNKIVLTDGRYAFEVCPDCDKFAPAGAKRWRKLPKADAVAVVDPNQARLPFE
jgi:hypothetical protein